MEIVFFMSRKYTKAALFSAGVYARGTTANEHSAPGLTISGTAAFLEHVRPRRERFGRWNAL